MSGLRVIKFADATEPTTAAPNQIVFFQENSKNYHSLLVSNSNGQLVKFADSRFSKEFVALDPVSNMQGMIFYSHDSFKILEILYVVREPGGSEINISIYKVKDYNNSAVTTLIAEGISLTSGMDTLVLNENSLGSDELLYLHIDSVNGEVNELFIQVRLSYV